MNFQNALVEWESSGLGDVPTEHMQTALEQLFAEFAKRGIQPELPKGEQHD